jgi:four helix bundle protein
VAGRSNDQFKNFLNIAIGSLNELNTQIEIALRVGYVSQQKSDQLQILLDECLAVKYGLKRSLERK